MDALSEAMRAVRVTGALFFNGEFAAPWRFATPAQDQIGSHGFHRIASGWCCSIS